MSTSQTSKIAQYLNEAHAMEVGLVRVLQEQIAMAPRGRYRDALETHVRETRDHADRVARRRSQLQGRGNPIGALVGTAQDVVGQALALGKAPLDLLRGSGGDEKVLKNAKDACATEALEIATYLALEHLASSLDDRRTAELAASIRQDEEAMLERITSELPALVQAVVAAEIDGRPSYDITETGAADALREAAQETKQTAELAASIREDEEAMLERITNELPALVQAVVGADIDGRPSYDITETGAADALREAAQETKQTARSAAQRTTRQARRVPGVARAEGAVRGAVASEEDLPIADYDSLTADEIVARLPELSQVELAKVDVYERKTDGRTTVLDRIATLRGDEPWAGYDEMTAQDVVERLRDGDDELAARVRDYERAHKGRATVLRAAKRELEHA